MASDPGVKKALWNIFMGFAGAPYLSIRSPGHAFKSLGPETFSANCVSFDHPILLHACLHLP